MVPIPPVPGYVLLFRGRGVVSWLIRKQTRSQYSHAALLASDRSTLIESWQGKGVQVKTITDFDGVDAFEVIGISLKQWEAAWEFALSQVGKGYDYRGVARFVTRSHGLLNDDWFCSELVFAALEHCGCILLARIDASEVSPAHLSFSTGLKFLPDFL